MGMCSASISSRGCVASGGLTPLEALVEQMHEDVRQTRERFAAADGVRPALC